MVQQLRQTAWNFEVPEINRLIAPIEKGYSDYRAAQQQGVENERQNKLLGFQEQRLGMEKQKFDSSQEEARLTRLGKTAAAIHQMPDGPEKQARAAALLQGHADLTPQFTKHGIDPANPVGAVGLLAQSWGELNPLDVQKKQAEIQQIKSHASYYNAGAANLRSKATVQPTQPQQPDPLAGYGISENGEMVPPSGDRQPARDPFDMSRAVPVGQINAHQPPDLSGRMNLGGPVDDIDRSMLPDEGRGRPQGVQVAQAGNHYTIGSGGGTAPPLMNQAMQRAFGPAGVTSQDVPGIVTDAGRNRRSDPAATREMQGQRAYDAQTTEQQQRLNKFRQNQQLWTQTYGSPPRAGYYYGDNGREILKSDRNYKGDEEQQRVIGYQTKAIDDAVKVLEKWSGNPVSYAARTVAGLTNSGEIGQAYADLALASTGPVYALSGKASTNAEMIRFARTFEPSPGEDIARTKMKAERLKKFYTALTKIKNDLGGADPLEPIHVQKAYLDTRDQAQQQPRQNPIQERLKSKYGLE